MFGIGSTEFLVIIVVAVLVLGPEHLPKVMRTISKVMSDFRRVSTDFQRTMNLEALEIEKQQAVAKPKKKKVVKTAKAAAPEDSQEPTVAETATASPTITAAQASGETDVVAAANAATEAAEAGNSAHGIQATLAATAMAANTLAPGQEAAPATENATQQATPVATPAAAETPPTATPHAESSASHALGINTAALFDLAALAEQQQREALAEAQNKAEATAQQQEQGTPA